MAQFWRGAAITLFVILIVSIFIAFNSENNSPTGKVIAPTTETINDEPIAPVVQIDPREDLTGELQNTSWIKNGGSWNSYDNQYIYWENVPISYSITPSCGKTETERIKQAFNIISGSTNNHLTFTEIIGDADIDLRCTSASDVSQYGTFETSGEAEVWSYGHHASNGSIVFNDIDTNFSYSGRCKNYPSTELHEILHTLGFGHIQNKKLSIMFELSIGDGCAKLDQDVIDVLNIIYR